MRAERCAEVWPALLLSDVWLVFQREAPVAQQNVRRLQLRQQIAHALIVAHPAQFLAQLVAVLLREDAEAQRIAGPLRQLRGEERRAIRCNTGTQLLYCHL